MHVHFHVFLCPRDGGNARVPTVPEDFLTVLPDDSPGIKKLKKLSALDSTQLENLPDDLKPARK